MKTVTIAAPANGFDPRLLSKALTGVPGSTPVSLAGAVQSATFVRKLSAALAGVADTVSLRKLDDGVRILAGKTISTVVSDQDAMAKMRLRNSGVALEFGATSAVAGRKLNKAELTYMRWLTAPMPKESDRPRKNFETTDDDYYGVYVNGRCSGCFDRHNLHVGPTPDCLAGMSGLVIPSFTTDRFEVEQSGAIPWNAFGQLHGRIPGKDSLTVRWRAGTLKAALYGITMATMEIDGGVYPVHAGKLQEAIKIADDKEIVTMRLSSEKPPLRFYVTGKSWAALVMGINTPTNLVEMKTSTIQGDVDRRVTIRSTTGDHQRRVAIEPAGRLPATVSYNWSL